MVCFEFILAGSLSIIFAFLKLTYQSSFG